MSSIQVVRKKREALAVPDLFRLLRFLSQQPYKMAVSGEIPSLTMANAVGLDPRRREWLNDGYLGRSVEVRFLFARSDWQQLEGLKVPNPDQILLRLVDAQEEAAFSSNHAWARSERMRITKEEIVAGHSAVQVRGFLRRFKHGFFMHSAAESFLQLNSGRWQSYSTIWSRSNSLNPQRRLGVKQPSRLQCEVMHLRMQQPRSQFLGKQQNGSYESSWIA